MSRYQNGLIYKIVCNDINIKECYIGSCCNFNKRKNCHKSRCNKETDRNYNLKVYKFIRENGGWDNWSMIQIETYQCETKRELETRERYFFETLRAELNSNMPARSLAEYEQTDKRKKYKKEYKKMYQKTEKFKTYQKEYKKTDRYKNQQKEYQKNKYFLKKLYEFIHS